MSETSPEGDAGRAIRAFLETQSQEERTQIEISVITQWVAIFGENNTQDKHFTLLNVARKMYDCMGTGITDSLVILRLSMQIK
jgi:hypothetical protein